jgi:hypothetical protein
MRALLIIALAIIPTAACGGGSDSADAAGCADGFTQCGGGCVDFDNDPFHCGDCDTICDLENDCVASECVLACAPGRVDCDGFCIDPMTHRDFCGATGDCTGDDRGVECEDGLFCDGAGACALECLDGFVVCDGVCTDPMISPEFCGATGDCLDANAGASCAADGFVCAGGECAFSCFSDLVDCDGVCVDPLADERYCGATADCEAANAGTECSAGDHCDVGQCCGDGEVSCMGMCIDGTTESNCGSCGNECADGYMCREGFPSHACVPTSCAAISANTMAGTGGFTIDPDGNGPIDVLCEMTIAGGGWTLVAKIENTDGVANWRPISSAWVDDVAFGTIISDDSKFEAFYRSRFDELLIMEVLLGGVEVQSTTGCLMDNTFKEIFSRDSEADADCAWSCSTTTVAGPWTGQSDQDSTLRFRCRDDASGTTTANGYVISNGFNSFMTTSTNRATSFGFGSGSGFDSTVDFDSTTEAGGDPSDSGEREIYGR